MYDSDYSPMATMSDAHSEWHRNAGVPMGRPGCPQDACDPDWLDEDVYGPQDVAPGAQPHPFAEHIVPADLPSWIDPAPELDPPF